MVAVGAKILVFDAHDGTARAALSGTFLGSFFSCVFKEKLTKTSYI